MEHSEFSAALQAATKQPTRTKQMLAYSKLGLSVLPLVPNSKTSLLKCYPALSATKLLPQMIESACEMWPRCEVGIVGGYRGFYCVDVDADEDRVEPILHARLGKPLAKIVGNRGFKALYRGPWAKPPEELTERAREYFNAGQALSKLEYEARERGWNKQDHEPTDEMGQATQQIALFKRQFDALLNHFIASNGLIRSQNKPVEVKSFRTISVLPPSRHAKTEKGYRYV